MEEVSSHTADSHPWVGKKSGIIKVGSLPACGQDVFPMRTAVNAADTHRVPLQNIKQTD